MRFGLFTLFDFIPGRHAEVPYYRDTLDLAILGEELGFDEFWVGEEHFYAFGICPSPQMFLTALAQRSERMRLGTAISLLPIEHPLRKAEDFALLDILSNGRLDFGTGRGTIQAHFDGFKSDHAESKSRYEEALEIIIRAWTEDQFSYDGRFWKVSNLSVSPKPIQRPHPPLFRAAISPESFEAAALHNQNVLLVPWANTPHSELRTSLDHYRDLVRSKGSTNDGVVGAYFMFCDRDHATAVRKAREITGAYVRHLTGFAKERDRQPDPTGANRNRANFIQTMVDDVEERAIVGTPDECIRRIEEIDAELGGIDQLAFYLHAGGMDVDDARSNITLFGREVLPHFATATDEGLVGIG
jgi:alkanesulfonate monooxygenase SsuD/methylene tetrahydromethanopterin reductase-like flavin-dependent oxidoreductase (luciferase family)